MMAAKKKGPKYKGSVDLIRRFDQRRVSESKCMIWQGDAMTFLKNLPKKPLFDLVVTSPPYNINKEYEKKMDLEDYLKWQKEIIEEIDARIKPNGGICWQVGNYVDNGEIVPLDLEIHPIFKTLKYKLRNRIVWHFGHGLHSKRRFSGRYEVVLWYTKSDSYTFNLDEVRVPSKYPGKRHFKGPNKGKFSSNPLGKNPEDVWDIPNVKGNHIEKTDHPCQFPVGLVERLLLALSNEGDLIFDPFCGVGSTGVASTIHKRKFWGCETHESYVLTGKRRLSEVFDGEVRYRSHDVPIYDHTKSNLSKIPDEHLSVLSKQLTLKQK